MTIPFADSLNASLSMQTNIADRGGPLSLVDGPYPTSEWNAQQEKYKVYLEHFSGDWLDETVGVEGSNVEKYPIKFNVFFLPVMLHASFLFGQVPDTTDPLVMPRVEMRRKQDSVKQDTKGQTDKELEESQIMTDFLNEVWYDNNGRSKQLELGIMSQVYGGALMGVGYEYNRIERYKNPLRIDVVYPEYFRPVWSPDDYYDLLWATIAYQISQVQAKEIYNVTTTEDTVLYREQWSRSEYEITIGDQVLNWNNVRQEGRPIGGFVPYTYIPHPPRQLKSFYGTSLLDRKLGLSKEINARMTDIGDTISQQARNIPMVSNTGRMTMQRISSQAPVIDLGKTQPGTQHPPTVVFPNGAAAQTSMSSVNYMLDLINLARSEAYTPPVVYGIDEGSQRSSLTLALRMIPLIAHITDERTYFDEGLNQVNKQLLIIAAEKGLWGGKITKDMVSRCRIHNEWSPILPRDVQQEINQLIIRLGANTISPKTAMEKMGDIKDIEGEWKLIMEAMEDLSKYQNQFGEAPGGLGMGENASMEKPKVDSEE